MSCWSPIVRYPGDPIPPEPKEWIATLRGQVVVLHQDQKGNWQVSCSSLGIQAQTLQARIAAKAQSEAEQIIHDAISKIVGNSHGQ